MSTVERQSPRTRTPAPTSHAFVAIVKRGVRDRRRAPLTWGGSLGALSALIVAIWPSIEDSISSAVEGYPEGLKQAFGITELNTVEAYLNAEMFSLIVPLAVAFFSVRMIVAAIASAEESGHLDTLLSAPVSRRVLAAGAFAAAGLSTAAVLVVTALITWAAAGIAGSALSLGPLAAGVAMVWALAMFFAGLALLATGPLHHPAAVTAVATGSLVAMYMVDVLGKVADSLEPLRWVSAFKYYGSALLDGLDPLAFAGLTLAGVVFAAVGALLFERRDVL